MIHIPEWEKRYIRKEQEEDKPSRKCEYCGWYLKGVCHYSGQYSCELDEVKE